MNLQQLHDYQKRTANFIAKHPRAIISVDMGLGKTAAVLGWMDWYARKRNYQVRGMIIAPKRVAENNWLQEAQKWRFSDEDACYNCNRRVYDMEKRAEVCQYDGHVVKPWWAPCEHHDRWFQGFGE